jgi:hypothetical protein
METFGFSILNPPNAFYFNVVVIGVRPMRNIGQKGKM